MITLEKKATYKYNIQNYKMYTKSNKDYFPGRLDLPMFFDSIRSTL